MQLNTFVSVAVHGTEMCWVPGPYEGLTYQNICVNKLSQRIEIAQDLDVFLS